MPAGRYHVGAGLGLRDRDPPVALERGVVVHLAVVGEHAAVAVVGVLVQAEVGDHDVSSPSSSRSALIARCAMPSGFHASDPSASLRAGTPNSMNAITPRDGDLGASLRSDSSVCWNCPGIDAIGSGVGDALLHEQRGDQLPGSELGLADQRSERRRAPRPSGSLLGEAHAPRFYRRDRAQDPFQGRDQALDRVRAGDGRHAQAVLPRLAQP